MDNNNALAVSQMATAEVGMTYCSITAENGDREASSKIYNAMNDPEYRVADFINKTIAVENVFIEIKELANEETGEFETAPRVVLIDDKGHAYQSVSKGMYNAVRNACLCFGNPPWEPALLFEIKQKAVKAGSMLTANIKG